MSQYYVFSLTEDQLSRVIAALSEQPGEQNAALIAELGTLAKLEINPPEIPTGGE